MYKTQKHPQIQARNVIQVRSSLYVNINLYIVEKNGDEVKISSLSISLCTDFLTVNLVCNTIMVARTQPFVSK